MRSRFTPRSAAGICVLAIGLLVGPQGVQADGVGDAQRKVNQILDQLENLRDQMAQIDEDYNGALDRQDELVVEIAASQTRVDEMTTVLGGVQQTLTQIALDRFTSGDSSAPSPIFSNAATYSEAGQRSALAMLALNTGEGNVDDLQSIVDDLAAERATLATKQEEATQLIATLEAKQEQMASLEKTYLSSYAKAERDLGKAKLRAAEQAREAAAAKKEQLAREQRARSLASIPRGGGSGPRYNGPIPQVSGSAGIAVQAAFSQIGVPYIAFMATPGVGFDCSGLTQWVWGQAGVSLPHQSGKQFALTGDIPQSEVQPGDLIFYHTPIHHVGIYVGNGQMIDAPAPGKYVRLATVNWTKVVGIGRPG
jgi:peptidoglycan DL-endopeptidase CwlO